MQDILLRLAATAVVLQAGGGMLREGGRQGEGVM